MSIQEGIQKIFKMILVDYKFELPVSWVWIGVNGAFLTGRIEFSKRDKELKSIILSGKAKKLRFPVNVMLVDAKGDAAHVLFRGSGEVDKVTRCRVDEPSPVGPPNWAKA
jgi:hypothetical protein